MNYIINHSTLLTNLVSFWEMQEESGTRYDAHGTNHLTANGTGGIGRIAGKVGWCADLERSDNDYLEITDASQTGLDIGASGADFSLSMVVKIESTPTQWFSSGSDSRPLISKYVSTGNQRSLFLEYGYDGTNYVLASHTSSDGISVTSSKVTCGLLTTGTLYHIVAIYDASAGTIQWYLDNTSLGTTTATTSIFNSTAPFQVGALSQQSTYTDSGIDQVGIWSKVLTSGEVSDLYNSGNNMGYGICFDAVTAMVDYGAAATTANHAHTCTGDDRGLYVYILTNNNPERTVSSVYWNTTEALTEVSCGRASNTGGGARTENLSLWYLKNPTAGSFNVTVTISGTSSNGFTVGTMSQNGVNQTTLEDDSEKNNNSGTTISASPSPTSTVGYAWAVTVARSDAGSVTDSTNYYGRSSDSSQEIGDSRFHLGTAGSKTVSFGASSGNNKIVTMLVRPASATAASGPANLKSYNTNVKANIKSINTNPIANIKSLNTNV